MRKSFYTSCVLLSMQGMAQVGINTSTPHASAALDITSTTKGFLPPRMTTTQRDAIANPASGLMVYNTTLSSVQINNGTSAAPLWVSLSSSSSVSTEVRNVYCSTNNPNTVSTLFNDKIPVFTNNAALIQNSRYTYYGADGSVWIWNGSNYISHNINTSLAVGQSISVYKTMHGFDAKGTQLPASGLIELDGLLRVGLKKHNDTFYKPYLKNITTSNIQITFVSMFRGKTIEHNNGVNVTIIPDEEYGIDGNNLTYWSDNATENLIADVIFPNGKWYQVEWYAYQGDPITNPNDVTDIKVYKNIYMRVFRKF